MKGLLFCCIALLAPTALMSCKAAQQPGPPTRAPAKVKQPSGRLEVAAVEERERHVTAEELAEILELHIWRSDFVLPQTPLGLKVQVEARQQDSAPVALLEGVIGRIGGTQTQGAVSVLPVDGTLMAAEKLRVRVGPIYGVCSNPFRGTISLSSCTPARQQKDGSWLLLTADKWTPGRPSPGQDTERISLVCTFEAVPPL